MIKSRYLVVISQFMAMFWLCSAQAAIITQTQDFRLYSPLVLGNGADVDDTEHNLEFFEGFDESFGTLNLVTYRYNANIRTNWTYTGLCTTGPLGNENCLPTLPSALLTHLRADLFHTGVQLTIPIIPIPSIHPGGSNVDQDLFTVTGPTGGGFSASAPVLSFATNLTNGINFFNASGFTEIIGSLSLEFDYTPTVDTGGGGGSEVPVSVPEPSTLGLLALGLMGLVIRHRNASKRSRFNLSPLAPVK